MVQLNLHVTPEFQSDLHRFMELRGLKHKSEAIRLALHEALQHSRLDAGTPDFSAWRGAATGRGQRASRFTDDGIWDGH